MASVIASNGRLYLLGRFPAKDGSAATKQYKITLQLDDTPANRKLANRKLARAEKDLTSGRWDWADWTVQQKPRGGPTWRDAIRLLYEKKVTLGRTSESTWHVNYMGTLKLMPQDEAITTDGLAAALVRYDRRQYTYKKLYYLLKDIATLTGVPFPRVGIPLDGRRDTPLDVPSDPEIIDWVLNAGEPYRWYFGVMATYGLRPHECDDCRLIEGNGTLLVQVDDETKTGYRTAIPVEQSWVDLFRLRDRTQRPTSTRNADRNDATSVWLNARRLKLSIQWRPYALRHAYAGRLWREGGSELTIDTAAKIMGHSVKEHLETYRRWIDPNQIAAAAISAIERNQAKKLQAAERLLRRDDRVDVDA